MDRALSAAVRIAGATALLLAWPALALACPVCFQGQSGDGTAGIRAAVLVLGGVTASVLACCGVFCLRLSRREASFRTPPEPFQPPPRSAPSSPLQSSTD